MNDDCPENITLEECLKRQLKKNKVKSIHASSVKDKPAHTPKISETTFQQLKTSSSPIKHSSASTEAKVSSPSFKTEESKVNSSISSNTSSSIGGGGSSSSQYSNAKNSSYSSKGGVVINRQTVVVKSNFEMAGRLNKSGKRPNAKAVGSHATASLNYMNNHGANDLENDDNLSNLFNAEGERIEQEQFNALKEELNDGIGAFRRIVIDAGQEFDREDMNRLVIETMQTFQEQTGKDFNYAFAVHNDTEHIHAHVLAYGESSEINMTKEHLQLFKEIAGEQTQQLINDKELEQDRHLSFHQQIDKQIDGVLDDKDDQQQTHKTSLSL